MLEALLKLLGLRTVPGGRKTRRYRRVVAYIKARYSTEFHGKMTASHVRSKLESILKTEGENSRIYRALQAYIREGNYGDLVEIIPENTS